MSYDNDRYYAAERCAGAAVAGLYIPPNLKELLHRALHDAFIEGTDWVTDRAKDRIMGKLFEGDDD